MDSDFLVIGSGMAGLSCAIWLAEQGNSVAVVTKKNLADSNTNQAQGGIAAVLGETDSFQAHLADTIQAGGGLCDENAVRLLVEQGPLVIEDLLQFGVRFSKNVDGGLDLGREGGHSHRRVAHAKDLTGAEIERALIERAKSLKLISIHENHMAVELVSSRKLGDLGEERIVGAYIMDTASGNITPFCAKGVILATGGAGKVYLYTSNPDIASGDGVALAFRAGAVVANMEFFQFHPTCLYHPDAKSFLISEAVRGEGARLKLADGSCFMDRYHPLGSLAPRDVVARAIDMEMKKRGEDCVFLDTTMVDPAIFPERFPSIYQTCLKFGFDPTRRMIPVVPAAHYMCGGVAVDTGARTSLPGLFAVGECAYTGVHGANRLASNSLLEAVVFAKLAVDSAIEWAKAQPTCGSKPAIPPWDPGLAVDADEQVVISHMWNEIRELMWNYVGIVRTDKRLARARRRMQLIRQEIDEYYWDFKVTPDLLELRNLAECARLIIECAIARKESRGLHFNLDHPETDDGRFGKPTQARRGVDGEYDIID
ncbi:MAG: L-aspartate oxidase [Nitrospinota bacterium]|nr:L-aspartate oxidase [Nitrospinota bacterium]MDH5756262.1 L-aspartate oxidase [Nitrospinota bacterium]